MTQSIQFNAITLAGAVSTFDRAQSEALAAKKAIGEGFNGLSFDAFKGRSEAVIVALVKEGMSANVESASKMLRRVLDDCGVQKPKSESVDAVKKAEVRAAQDKKVEALIAEKKPADILKAAQKGDTVAAKAIAEMAATAKKAEKAKTGDMLAAIRKELAHADSVKLKQIAAILGIKGA